MNIILKTKNPDPTFSFSQDPVHKMSRKASKTVQTKPSKQNALARPNGLSTEILRKTKISVGFEWVGLSREDVPEDRAALRERLTHHCRLISLYYHKLANVTTNYIIVFKLAFTTVLGGTILKKSEKGLGPWLAQSRVATSGRAGPQAPDASF